MCMCMCVCMSVCVCLCRPVSLWCSLALRHCAPACMLGGGVGWVGAAWTWEGEGEGDGEGM